MAIFIFFIVVGIPVIIMALIVIKISSHPESIDEEEFSRVEPHRIIRPLHRTKEQKEIGIYQ